MSNTPYNVAEAISGIANACSSIGNVFDDLNDAFREAFGFEPQYRRVIPAQDVVIEDVIEDETKEDEDDGGNLCNRALPDVR